MSQPYGGCYDILQIQICVTEYATEVTASGLSMQPYGGKDQIKIDSMCRRFIIIRSQHEQDVLAVSFGYILDNSASLLKALCATCTKY